ncbi:hypothetical protein EB18_01549 [Enterococcus cecorum]|uniref:Uncharacterized protein n=1 Tax=Enterococcus cecorum TaxID=44008 RepID=A0A366SFD2_9ENTE|nr:hypothetical protein EB08_01571 [Enterococcus cecorum]RBR28932.1 hypothetical protein EB18_01549 [Enterococcus cecorum]RBR33343.1 hypothetical protein EB26_01909 [Enterococcus cecorum]RBR35574.1 hypothetical protein EB31_01349 [Enterococcus cecorum]
MDKDKNAVHELILGLRYLVLLLKRRITLNIFFYNHNNRKRHLFPL